MNGNGRRNVVREKEGMVWVLEVVGVGERGEEVVIVVLKCMWVDVVELVKGRGGEWGGVDRFVLKKVEIVWSKEWV